MESMETFLFCLLICIARISDVTFGTLRTISIVKDRIGLSLIYGFLEVSIWLFSAMTVLTQLNNIAYAVAYCIGYTAGIYVGMLVERLKNKSKQKKEIVA